MSNLHFVIASTEEEFRQMSRIHAEGWRTTYVGAVPAEYMDTVITDDHWVPIFGEATATGQYQGLILYDGDQPVACGNFGAQRIDDPAYAGWGEVVTFYTHPNHKGKGYGGLLIEEMFRLMRQDGFSHCYVLVLRENDGARRFYASHGMAWDGTWVDIPFPPDAICVDLRYTRAL